MTDNSLEIILVDNTTLLDEILVLGQSSVTKEFSVKELDRITIYMLPVSNGDPLKAISFLPYSTNTSESANPELRGSISDFSRVVVNNVPVYNPVKNTQLNGMGNFSLLNTELIEEQLVYAGNPPLKYGNSISGLVEIKTLNELINPSQLKLALSLANMGFLYSKELKKKTFFQIYGNHQFSSAYLPVNKSNIAFIKDFTATDLGVNYHLQIDKQLSANVYTYMISETYNADNTSYNYYGNLLAKAKRNFNIINIEYQSKSLILNINNGTNFSMNDFAFGNLSVQQKDKQIYTSIETRLFISPELSIQTGVTHDYSKVKFSNIFPYYVFSIFPNDSTYSFAHNTQNHNIEAYTYSKASIGNFIVGIGLRKNIPNKNQQSYWSYQANLKYILNNKNSILLSGGRYNGYYIPNYYIEYFYPVSSTQIALDYLYHTNQCNINFSIYKKKEKTPFFYQELGVEMPTQIKLSGAELSVNYSLKAVSLEGSYVWLYSNMNKGEGWFRGYNNMNYFVRGIISHSNERWFNTSLNFTFRPGLYYTPVSKALFDDEANNYKPEYGSLNSQKYKNYSSIDLTLNKILPYKEVNMVLFCTISNLLNTTNQAKSMYNYDYSVKEYWQYQKRLLYFGVMITL